MNRTQSQPSRPKLVDMYLVDTTPATYVCSECGATDVKLWRRYQESFEHQLSLLCLKCVCHEQGVVVPAPTADGYAFYTEMEYWYRTADTAPDCWIGYDPEDGPPANSVEIMVCPKRTDQIGSWVSAVPIEGRDDEYWGYLATPQSGCDWWANLPSAKTGKSL